MKDKDMKKKVENQRPEENEDVDTNEEEEKGCAKKSEGDEISEDDLEKSLQKLTDFTEENDEPSRKDALLEKAQKEDLSKSEVDELSQILGGGESPEKETLKDEVQKSMEPSEDLQKAIDVSTYLEEDHANLVKSQTVLAEHIQKSDARQNAFNLMLAKAVADVGRAIQGVKADLGVIGEQPARPAKSKRTTAIQKSFANQPPDGENLSKSEILNTMTGMVEKSYGAGQEGMVNGVNMLHATTKYESTGHIDPNVLAMVQQERKSATN